MGTLGFSLGTGGGGGSVAFAPTDVSGLKLWLKADSLSLTYAVPYSGGNPDLTGATVHAVWYLQTVVIGRETTTATTATLTADASVSDAGTANQTVTIQLTAAQTALLTGTPYRVCLVATLADGKRATFARKTCTIVNP